MGWWLPRSAGLDASRPVLFRADRVAIVVGADGTYHGLITKIDMINYLRRQLPNA